MNRPLRIYISGPITGMPQMNRPEFDAAADEIRDAGLLPVNPFDLIDHERAARDGWQWSDYMRVDIAALCECDVVLMLKGWQLSRGANAEYEIAHRLGIPSIEQEDLLLLRAFVVARRGELLTDERMDSVREAMAKASSLMTMAEVEMAEADQLREEQEGAA